MSPGLTQGLVDFIVDPGMQEVPDDVLPIIRNGFIDTIACLLSGRDEPVTQVARQWYCPTSAPQGSSVLLGGEKAAAAQAALVNAVSAHALDFDDMALNSHPSVVLVPALLAVGEPCNASVRDIFRAYLVGYEVWAELLRREPDPLHSKGWHPTSALGTVACAAAVAHLLSLTSERVAHALGCAASMASGLVGNFGSMTKPLHAGWAARNAIEAVQLASLGITASPHVLEAANGYLAALSPHGRRDLGPWTPPPDLRIRSNGLSFKKYPVCYAAHRVIDGVLQLRAQHGFQPCEVVEIRPTLSDVNARVLHAHRPVTALQAKFSIEFAAAMAACDGAVGLPQVTDEQVMRPDVQRMMTQVHATTVAAGCPVEPGFALHDRVVIQIKDGRVLDSGPIRFATGHAHLPLERDGLAQKFIGCVRAHEVGHAQALLSELSRMNNRTSAPLNRLLDAHWVAL